MTLSPVPLYVPDDLPERRQRPVEVDLDDGVVVRALLGLEFGFAVPTYVIDAPGGGGKIPVMPNYLISYSDHKVVLRNYEGMLVRYQAEDKPNVVRPTATRGVSHLLQGTRSVIVPEGNERMARRELHVLGNHHAELEEMSGSHGNGCCEGGEEAMQELVATQ